MKTYVDVVEKLAATKWRGGINYSLDRLKAPLAVLGDPHQHLPPVIHVAGTNGKGSTVEYLAVALQRLGFSVGTYTSPHLQQYTERISLNGHAISESDFSRLFQWVEKTVSFEQITEFEILTMMAFLYFLEQTPDFVILETGLGGRLDATNVATPILSLITKIGMDHQTYLGDSLKEIAAEKAGIIKTGVPVITVEGQEPAVLACLCLQADRQSAPLDIAVPLRPCPATLPLFQSENMGLVLAAVGVLAQYGYINGDMSYDALCNDVQVPGRFQVMKSEGQTMVLDVAHNPLGLEVLCCEYRRQFPGITPTIVTAFSKGRDPKPMMAILKELSDDIYYLDQGSPYLIPYSELKNVFPDLSVLYCNSDLISYSNLLITGSFYLMDEIALELRKC